MSLILPRRFKSQPQGAVSLSPEFKRYNPKIVTLPSAGVNLVNNAGITFANDAVVRNGNFTFPGVNGYVDLGSETHIGAVDYTVIAVSRTRTISAFPVIFGLKSSGFGNLMGFYDTGSYKDITIGNGGTSSGEIYSLSKFGSVIGTWHNLVYVKRSTGRLFCNGTETTLSSTAGLGSSTGNNCLGQLNPGSLGNDFVGEIALFAVFNGVLPDHLALKVSADPWSLFQAEPRRIWVAAASTGSYTLPADSGSFSVTGADASLEYNRKLSADSGAFAISGTAATFTKGYRLSAESSAFAVTGTAATFRKGVRLAADSGSFEITGTDAALKSGRIVQADSGSFSVTGTAASLEFNRVLQADSGSVAVTGTSASLEFHRVLAADSGSIQITGTDATLTRETPGNYSLTAESGSVSVTGTDATLKIGRSMSAESGSFAFTGSAASLRYARLVITEAGQFAITGTAATLTRTGGPEAITSTVERTATFQRTKNVNVRFN